MTSPFLSKTNFIPRFAFPLLLTLLSFSQLQAQSLVLQWKLETSGKIVAGTIANDRLAFVGNEDGTFVAVELENGELAWKVETNGNIQDKAQLAGDLVFIESANVFYAFDKETGKEIWKYDQEAPPEKFAYQGKEYLYKLDPFDDKRSSGFLHQGRIYVGSSNGKVIGLNAETGVLEFSVDSKTNSPVRSSPMVSEDRLYFGDWNGIVYCYDLEKETFLWTKETYQEKPYDTFGGIASEFYLYQGKLFFGARNPELYVLNSVTGQEEWTYTDPSGGWIIGDPVIYNDTLYIGGSDNYSMLAFNPSDGELLWQAKRTKNIYGKPVVNKEWVIYGGGNSYNTQDTGEIVVLDRVNGSVIATYETASSVFSSPVMTKSGSIIFGSSDGTIYALKVESE